MILPEPDRTFEGLDYCLLCGGNYVSGHQTAADHVRLAHTAELDGASPTEGVHWASAWQVGVMRERREMELLRFQRNLESLRGADDFLLEAGDA